VACCSYSAVQDKWHYVGISKAVKIDIPSSHVQKYRWLHAEFEIMLAVVHMLFWQVIEKC
jgi:hypothetical protein